MPRRTKDNPFGLEPVMGCAVTEVGIEISNAAGGLNPALELDKDLAAAVAKMQIGDSGYVLLRVDMTKVRYQPVKTHEDQLKQVSIFRCTDAAVVDSNWAIEAIDDEREKLRALREKAEGVQTLPGTVPQRGGADDDKEGQDD